MITLNINRNSSVPAYEQLKQALVQRIDEGVFKPGDKVPSVRALVRQTGLSHITVARSVSELVQERILLSQHGKGAYVRGESISGAAPATKPRNIALIHPRQELLAIGPSKTPFAFEVFQGINEYCGAKGHGLVPMTGEEFINNKGSVPVDGGIVMWADTSEIPYAALRETGRPIVQILRSPTGEGGHFIDSSYMKAGYDATRHLLEYGHRRIAFLHTSTHSGESWHDRIAGFRQALDEFGVPEEQSRLYDVSQTVESGQEVGRKILSEPNPPTAFITLSDLDAVGVLRAAEEAGYSVPKELSIVGFLGLSLVANNRPKLTTVDLHLRELGWEAAAALESILSGQRRHEVQISIQSSLRIGETTGPAPAREKQPAGNGSSSPFIGGTAL